MHLRSTAGKPFVVLNAPVEMKLCKMLFEVVTHLDEKHLPLPIHDEFELLVSGETTKVKSWREYDMNLTLRSFWHHTHARIIGGLRRTKTRSFRRVDSSRPPPHLDPVFFP